MNEVVRSVTEGLEEYKVLVLRGHKPGCQIRGMISELELGSGRTNEPKLRKTDPRTPAS